MFSPTMMQYYKNLQRAKTLLPLQSMLFTGKTESGFKFKTPKLRLRVVRPIPPPGVNLQVPADLTPELFCK